MDENPASSDEHPSGLPDDYFRQPSAAGLWNYLLGGKDNHELDRAAAEAMVRAYPDMFYMASQQRQFLVRAVRLVAERYDVRQFLDIGCGLPSPREGTNTHEVAQSVHPEARIVYVDNDKVVLTHARALLVSSVPNAGPIVYIDSDARDIDYVLDQAGRTLDYTHPVGVLCFGLLGHISDYDEALAVVAKIVATVPSGSFLILEDGVDDTPGTVEARQNREREYGGARYIPRSPEQFARYFDGLELLEPGIVPTTRWRLPKPEVGTARPVASRCGVARKP